MLKEIQENDHISNFKGKRYVELKRSYGICEADTALRLAVDVSGARHGETFED